MFQKNRPRIWPYILLLCSILTIVGAIFVYRWVMTLTPKAILQSSFVQKQFIDTLDAKDKEFIELGTILLGFDKPQTYLILFENNTELRPGGGFIGTYAVVHMEDGKPNVLVVDGTENLDKKTPSSWQPTAPTPLTKHLGVDRWYFRDSNWSPDFALNAQRALEFYTGEGGLYAQDIDAVVALTPTVLEEILRLVGPVTLNDIQFSHENVVEKLEYEVEYGFVSKDIAASERKQIIFPLFQAILKKVERTIFTDLDAYALVAKKLAEEKHVLVYSRDASIQRRIEAHDWGGIMQETTGDYLLWTDANLAALKTDHAMKRTLTYAITKHEERQLVATATMHYVHEGTFDWRTTRYLSFVRIFVPHGAMFVSAQDSNGHTLAEFDQGEEAGKQWFGGYIRIEPAEEYSVSFTYRLPSIIEKNTQKGVYSLVVQKQLGTIAHGLTLDLDFGTTTIQKATPAEKEEQWGDGVYELLTDLRVDRNFLINF